MDRLQSFLQNKTNLILLVVLILLALGAIFGAKKLLSKPAATVPLEEIDLPFDPEGPIALISPRRDGNAIVLNIQRVASYEAISYELAYQSDGIDRGVQGSLDASGKKNEYNQEILFGTCSKGDTFSTLHCVFDKDVENGTLTLRIQKQNKIYRMISGWHLQKPDVALGIITSADSHFSYKTTAKREDLALVGFSLVNDLSAVPKLPTGKQVLGKVYAFNVPVAKTFPKGDVTIELISNPPSNAKIARYDNANNTWEQLDTKISGSTLKASASSNGIFTVLVDTVSASPSK